MSRIYEDDEQLTEVYTAMFDAVADDASIDDLGAQRMVINFRLHDPDATPIEFSTPASSMPACIIPGPAPVTVIHPRSANAAARFRACA